MGKKVYIKTGENNLEQVILKSNLSESETNLRNEFVAQIDKTAAELYDDVGRNFLKNSDVSDYFKIVDNEGNVGLKFDSNGLYALDFIADVHKLSEKANNTDLINHINNVQTHLRISDIINLINKHFQEQIKEGNNIDITDNTISVKGYVFDDILKSFSEGENGLFFIDSGEDAEVLTNSTATPTNRFETKLDLDITKNNLIKIDKIYYHITDKETTDGINFIYTVDESTIFNSGRIYYFERGATGYGSHSEGGNTKAIGNFSHAEGNHTLASGYFSHTEGSSSYSEGIASHSEGSGTRAHNYASHAEGYGTTASGDYSHAEGDSTIAKGNASHSEGYFTITTNPYEHAEGKFNKSNIDTISSIGIGTSTDDRKNAFEVLKNGDTFIYGVGKYDGTDPDPASSLQNIINDNIYEIGEMPETDCYAWYSQKDGIPDITMKCFWQTHGNYVIVSLKNVKVIANCQDIYYSLPKQVYDGFDVSGVFVSYTSNEIIGWSTMVHEGVNVIRFRKTSGSFTTNDPGINITFQYRYK